MFGFFRTRRRRALLAEPFPNDWERAIHDQFAAFDRLPRPVADRVRAGTRILLAEKNWEGCNGLDLTDEMRAVIAAQAALMLAGDRTPPDKADWFGPLTSVLVYPTAYRVTTSRLLGDATMGGGPEISDVEGRLGEAHMGGAVVLSWPDVLAGAANPDDGRNLVFHEFAHVLDLADRYADGVPGLSGSARLRWEAVADAAFEKHAAEVERGLPGLLDAYGATNPAEFFAVATECFFEKPRTLRMKLPDLFGILREFYNLDPGEWSLA
ncbi:M90 family metallopeptidase [Alienimonas chondri]|uniref:Protein MtfA n=1 Tax=Alienimonas chondri TaxID=2681879 RepID=A0ABX1VHS4_9PLAN|nr:M90 family metallopeptidase [Alienimonas chondri]NNJ26326.1 Protein MtfA [Alienimonas chondri]